MLTDPEIYGRIKSGDRTAFEAFFKAHYSHLCAYANKYVQNNDAAEEIVQDLFVNFWQKKEELMITSSLPSYFFRAVHNSCLNYIKQRTVHRKHEEIILQETKDNIYHEPFEPDDHPMEQTIRAAIDKLPPERRKIFIMNRFNELSYKEIAGKLGLSVKTVENQIGKALKFLREELKDHIPALLFLLSAWADTFFKK